MRFGRYVWACFLAGLTLTGCFNKSGDSKIGVPITIGDGSIIFETPNVNDSGVWHKTDRDLYTVDTKPIIDSVTITDGGLLKYSGPCAKNNQCQITIDYGSQGRLVLHSNAASASGVHVNQEGGYSRKFGDWVTIGKNIVTDPDVSKMTVTVDKVDPNVHYCGSGHCVIELTLK
jgi:hypothetical protein